jgi:hypothetical protein
VFCGVEVVASPMRRLIEGMPRNPSAEKLPTTDEASAAFPFASLSEAASNRRAARSAQERSLPYGLFVGLGIVGLIALGALVLWQQVRGGKQNQIARHIERLELVPKDGTDWQMRLDAIDELGEMGPDAAAAVPVLRTIRDREDWPEAYSEWERKLKKEEMIGQPWLYESPRRSRTESANLDLAMKDERERAIQLSRPPAEMSISGEQFVRARIAEEREHAARALARIGSQ